MAFLIDIISDRHKQKYKDNAVDLVNNVSANIESKYYRIPTNGLQSANQFWYNLLLITPCADGHTYTRAFMPSEKENMIIWVRFSNHPCGPLSN